MDSVLVGTPEGHVNGWTVGERRMRFSLGGLSGNVVSLWDLGEMGVLAGAIGDDSVANFYLLCSEDLARAFASRSSQES
ncbi:hypothetical protein IIA16_00255 [bacterium]|nr:hypothetical protein [bacterium]